MFFLKRRWLDYALDGMRFRLDCFPSLDYHPLPWLGRTRSQRALGCETRWNSMKGAIAAAGVQTAVDIGCNAGFFAVHLAQLGVKVVGVESEPKFQRMALHTIRTLRLEDTGILHMKLTPDSAALIPSADSVLFLSVWHHLVKEYSFPRATDILQSLWLKTLKVMFFETGEAEMPSTFGLPRMQPSPVEFLSQYLHETCTGGTVLHLGLHPAQDPCGNTVQRNLFAVAREPALSNLTVCGRLGLWGKEA